MTKEEKRTALNKLVHDTEYDVTLKWGTGGGACPQCGEPNDPHLIGTVSCTGSYHTGCVTCIESPTVMFATGFKNFTLSELEPA